MVTKYNTLRLRCVIERARVVSYRMQLVRATKKEHAMIRFKAVTLVSLVGVGLALAPLSSAFADIGFRNGQWGHGGHAQVGDPGNGGYGGHGGYYGGAYGHGSGVHGGYYGAWPLFGLGAAVVGAAAAI